MKLDFYRNKRIFVTGHTGFKGMWLCKLLTMAGAEVTGYALAGSEREDILRVSEALRGVHSVIGDVRDRESLAKAFAGSHPEIVFHLAAQPLVRQSYRQPVETYETNVMGTVNLLECVRQSNSVRSFLNVTTDKVYENKEWVWGYRENEPLDGYDPYSNSKSCSELVTHSYAKSFLKEQGVAVSTARAGNVIGGGDRAADRILPDCIRSAVSGKKIMIRNSLSIRPYQHVLEALDAYLLIAAAQYQDSKYAGAYNVGPDECDCVTTGQLAEMFCTAWGQGQSWQDASEAGPHEANYLRLDSAKLKSVLQWRPLWHIAEAVGKTVEWEKIYAAHGDVAGCMEKQIEARLCAI
jgi:CDP-glucose 4,6-dehydratase